MSKRRKYKRSGRRGGRVMTVTTTSRVVKTTRMNPHGLSLEPYTRKFTFGRDRHTESVSHTHSREHLRKMMRELFSGWSKEQHAERWYRLWHELHYAKGLWGRFADRAHAETFPGQRRGFADYKISGIGRDEYPERMKTRLRAAARAESVIQSAIHAHEMMTTQAALKKVGKKYGPMGWKPNPGGAEISDEYRDEFFQHYLIAALWSSMDNSDPETGGEPLDKNYDIDDIAPDSLKKLRADCDRFIDKYAKVLAALDADGRETAEQAGHDLWLTRNGHGAGFWDRGLGKVGDVLAKAVGWRTAFPEINLEVGDDGKIHAMMHGGSQSNPRPSKTHIEFIIQGNYGQGWEDENTELTREDAKRSLREYRENGPGAYRLIRRRVKNDATNPVDPRTAPTVRIPAVVRASIPAGSSDPRRAVTRRLQVVRVGAARSNPEGGYWAIMKNGMYCAGRGQSSTSDPAKATKFLSEMGARSAKNDWFPRGSGWRVVRLPADVRAFGLSNPPRLALRLSSATWRRLPKADRRSRGSVRFVRCKTSKRGTAHWLRCVVR